MDKLNEAMCELIVEDNITIVSVKSVIEDVYYNDMGVLKNPSKLKSYRWWGTTI